MRWNEWGKRPITTNWQEVFVLKYITLLHYVTLTAIRCFEKWNFTMHVNTLHKIAILVKPGHIFWRKFPLVFPLMSYNCSVRLQPFILAELFPTTTRCCSCSFALQAAHMLLWRTSVNLELRQIFTKIAFLCHVLTLSFIFQSSGSRSKLHSVALTTNSPVWIKLSYGLVFNVCIHSCISW